MTHDMGRGTPGEAGHPGESGTPPGGRPPAYSPPGMPPGTPPGAPGPYGPYGPVPGPGGWGGWMPPPAPPKPGVIPLGPLGVGDIIGGGFATMGRAWKQLLGMSLLVFSVVTALIGGALLLAYISLEDLLDDFMRGGPEALNDTGDLWSLALTFLGIWLGSWIVMYLGMSLIQVAAVAALQDAALGRPVRFGAMWRSAWTRVWSVLLITLVTALIALVPVLLFILGGVTMVVSLAVSAGAPDVLGLPGWLIPLGLLGGLGAGLAGIWLWVQFTLAPAAVVFEGLGPFAALGRSVRLVKGCWWRVFGISLLGAIIAGAISWVLNLPFQFMSIVPGGALPDDPNEMTVQILIASVATSMAFGLLGQMLGTLVTAVYPPLVNALLYVDRRMRTENLAASLAEAAGVTLPPQPAYAPPYGPPPAR